MKDKIDADKIFDEFVETSLFCASCIDKTEEWTGVDANDVREELKIASEKMKASDSKVYVLSDGQKKEIPNEIAMKNPESLLNVNMIDVDSRNGENKVEIDFRFKYLNEIVRYMGNEYDIDELNGTDFDEFCRELMEMNIPFRADIMGRLCNGSNEYGVGWKNRCVVVNGNEYYTILRFLKKVWKLSELRYNNETDRIECIIDDKYEPIIQSFSTYLQDKSKDDELRSVIDRKLLNSFIDEYPLDMNNKDVQDFFYPIYSPFLKESIINEEKYDDKLREWCGDYKWKLLYRASEHEYTAESFHECCDDIQGPTLIIIKSDEGLIFGGYTTLSWSEDGIYNDMLYDNNQ